MFVTNNELIFKEMMKLRNHGLINRDQCDLWGYNCRLDEIQAAALRVFMPQLDKWTERRRELAFRYNELLDPYVKVPLEAEGEYHAYQTYMVVADLRDELQAHLRKEGVEALVHYPVPIHRQPAASYLRYKVDDFPVTEYMADRVLSLPIYPEMDEGQQDYVVGQVARFYAS
jgi:dTDP-4-amino-4,6-dideoxygalactose transaminase